MKVFRIDGRREFCYNGRKFRVQNLCEADKKTPKEKYYLTVREKKDGYFSPAYNNTSWNLEHFETIKDAQRYVRDWDFMLETMW